MVLAGNAFVPYEQKIVISEPKLPVRKRLFAIMNQNLSMQNQSRPPPEKRGA